MIHEWIALVLLLLGAFILFLASLGVLTMPDFFMRMQAASKASSLGAALMLAGVAVYFGEAQFTTRALAAIAFVFLTVPVSAHLLARAAFLMGVPMWKGTRFVGLPGYPLTRIGESEGIPPRKEHPVVTSRRGP
jgi:multicomponent Na+:H+ antiporter subunit G